MWRRIVNIVVMILAWSAILAYIIYASSLTRQHRNSLQVQSVEIEIKESSATSRLADSDLIENQLRQAGFSLVGENIEDINALGITELLSKNGFVERVDVYASLSGKVHIDITQHKPIVRLRTEGYNAYMTRDGYIFRSPEGSAYHTAVVTGSFRPLTPPNYEGHIETYLQERLSHLHKQSVGIQISNGKEWESSREYRRIATQERRLRERYDDICKLTNIVDRISNHPFWGAEVVQFVADTTSNGAISLSMIPRSGDFTITFGELQRIDEKLEKLEKFYNDGLTHLGWDRFKTIDIRYDKQVICRE